MDMYQQALTVIFITSLALPYLAFAVHNSFRSHWLNLLRAVVAVGVGWAFMLAYVFAADGLHRASASTPEQIEALNNGDGAKFAFAAVLGWVIPAIIVGASWLFHGVLVPRFRTKNFIQLLNARPRVKHTPH